MSTVAKPFTYAKVNPKLVAVRRNGIFIGHIAQYCRTAATGLHRQRHNWWEGTIGGVLIRKSTLTAAKADIASKVATTVSA